MKVLLSVASFSPDYGGPALSVSRLGAALAKAGCEVALFAPDGSAKTSPIVTDAARFANGHPLLRLMTTPDAALDAFGPDILHDNGIWLPYNHAFARKAAARGVPRVVAPRGMLEPWAFRYKPWKKRIAWALYQKHNLRIAAALHATANEEANNLTQLSLHVPIVVASNGVDVPESTAPQLSNGDTRTLLFLSRIHPKKGLALLVEAFARLKPQGWRVVIAGPEELGHTVEIKTLARTLGVDDCIEFIGPKYGDEKEELFSSASAFVLPTFSENFGIVVAEALAHGLPVITTYGAPWSDLVTYQCGWWVEPSVDGMTSGLGRVFATTDSELDRMGIMGKALVVKKYGWDRIAETMVGYYKKICGESC